MRLRDLPGGAANDVYAAYDLAGRRLSARFGSASGQGVIAAYDSAGRLASETSTIGPSRTLAFQYDAASNRTRLTWPDGLYAQYTYDGLNRVSAIRENGAASGPGVLATYAYDPLSRRVSVTRGNGTMSTYAYDSASRLTNLTQDLSGAANDQTYGFSYTAASQISQRTAANDNYNWTGPNVSRTYTRNGLNQYTSVAGTNFTYDARGILTSDGSRAFAYDLENHLTSVSGGASLSLAYDPLGRLRQTTAAGATTDFLYDGDRLVAEYNSAGTLLRRYVHGPGVDEPLVSYEGAILTDRRYLLSNHQGSVIAEEGASTTRYSYGPYGEPGAWASVRFRYTGQMALPEAQLYHYRARVYDPILGRFLQTDPVGYQDDFNLYAYVSNDPLNTADPSGTDAVVLTTDFFAGSARHQAVLVGNDNTGWRYYSLEGTIGPFNLPHGFARYDVRGFSTLQQALASAAISTRYVENYRISTTTRQDVAMNAAARAFVRTHPIYDVTSCNCGDLVQAVVSIADPDFRDTINPNETLGHLRDSPNWHRTGPSPEKSNERNERRGAPNWFIEGDRITGVQAAGSRICPGGTPGQIC